MKYNIDKKLLWNISKSVFIARSRIGLTQKELAKKVGTEQSGIARLENSTHFPSLRFISKVAHALDQDIVFKFTPKDSNDIRFRFLKDDSNISKQFQLKSSLGSNYSISIPYNQFHVHLN